MTARQWISRLARSSMLVALAAAVALAPRPAAAGDLAKLDTSLKLLPADASFYSSLLRNREQFEAVKHSNAWAKIAAMPIVQSGLMLYDLQVRSPGSIPEMIHSALTSSDNRDTVALLKEMVSDEVFAYGDKSAVDFVRLSQIINTAQSFGSMREQVKAESEDETPGQVKAKAVLSALAAHVDLIRVPNVVIGFKLKNTKLAKEQLAKIEETVKNVLDANEKTKGRLKKTTVNGHECLVLTLDGSLAPWEILEDRLKEMEAKEGDAQKIIAHLEKSKLVVALCLRDNYLLASIGSSLDCLEKLGKGERLIDRRELKPLAKFVDKRLTAVAYVSATMNEQLADQQQVNSLLKLVDEYLPETGLNDQQKVQVQKDAQALAADIKNVVPKPGAAMGVSFLADRGVENYRYSWGSTGDLDASKPLGLLDHVGGNSLFGLVSRQKVNMQHYDLLIKWVKIGYGYVKDYVLPTLSAKDKEKTQKFFGTAIPLVERLDKVNREMLFPALADGQLGLVVDAKLTSDHFAKPLPATEKPMPMVNPALVLGVSDAKLLVKAMGQYREIANGLIDAARQIEGNDIPPGFAIPEPKVSETSSGKIYSFALPAELGADPQIVPNFGLSDKVAIVAITRDHTERLLKSTPPTLGGLLAKTDRPLGVAVWFRWADLLDAAKPWVDFGIEQATANIDDEEQKTSITEQVHTAVDVLKVLRNVTSESYLEDGSLVIHTFAELHDVAK